MSNQIPLSQSGFEPRIREYELPGDCIEFYRNDEEYRAWLRANPDGWVMNNYRRGNGPIPAFRQMENAFTIHHVTSSARHLSRSDTKSYRKLCCVERKPLEDFKRIIMDTLNAPKPHAAVQTLGAGRHTKSKEKLSVEKERRLKLGATYEKVLGVILSVLTIVGYAIVVAIRAGSREK